MNDEKWKIFIFIELKKRNIEIFEDFLLKSIGHFFECQTKVLDKYHLVFILFYSKVFVKITLANYQTNLHDFFSNEW